MAKKVAAKARTSLYLDPALYKALRIAAIEEELPATQLIERLVREYLERRPKPKR
jgi:hypothetical protein